MNSVYEYAAGYNPISTDEVSGFNDCSAVRVLIHHQLCPFSRTVRLVLAEKELPFRLIEENFFNKRPQFLELSPSGRLPVCIEDGGRVVLTEAQPIVEYYEDMGLGRALMPSDPYLRAMVRCTIRHIEDTVYRDCIAPLLNERAWKRLSCSDYPDGRLIRQASDALRHHLRALSQRVELSNALVGEHLTLADLTAAAHLSTVDFLGDIPWDDRVEAQQLGALRVWYARIKSRKSFRSLLRDNVRGFTPPEYYIDPDF